MLNPAQSNLLTISCSSKSRLVLPFWYLLTQVVPEQFQNSSVVCVCVCYCCLIPLPKKEVMFLVRSVCLSVCPLDYSQTCERIFTKFFGGVGHGSRTKWYNFGGDPDHTSDPGVQSPKSGSSASVEVCALWAYLVIIVIVVKYIYIALSRLKLLNNSMAIIFRIYVLHFVFYCCSISRINILVWEHKTEIFTGIFNCTHIPKVLEVAVKLLQQDGSLS